MTATVQVTTTDTAWAAKHSTGTVEERVTVPGCRVTGSYRMCGMGWLNYSLPAGVPIPSDWDRGVERMLAAPAIWVEVTS